MTAYSEELNPRTVQRLRKVRRTLLTNTVVHGVTSASIELLNRLRVEVLRCGSLRFGRIVFQEWSLNDLLMVMDSEGQEREPLAPARRMKPRVQIVSRSARHDKRFVSSGLESGIYGGVQPAVLAAVEWGGVNGARHRAAGPWRKP